MTVTGFWQWSSSDLLGNALRGLVAEYLVAEALGGTAQPRVEWDSYDIKTPDGIKVEVKSSAYLQSWKQGNLSALTFSIRETRGWDAATNTSADVSARQADVYVFCVLAHQDKATVDPLNLDQWDFYVLSSREINERLGAQRTAALATLQRIGARKVRYPQVAHTVRLAFAQSSPESADGAGQ